MHYSALFWHQYSPRIVFSQTFETLQMCSIRVALTAALWCDFESWQCCVSQLCYQFTGLAKSINSKPCIWSKLLNIPANFYLILFSAYCLSLINDSLTRVRCLYFFAWVDKLECDIWWHRWWQNKEGLSWAEIWYG